MKTEFSNLYRKKFNQLDTPPPKEVWENISNELDLREVWTNINFELKKKSRRKSLIKYLSYFIIILFGTGTLFFYFQTDSVNSNAVAHDHANNSRKTSFVGESHFSHLEIHKRIEKTGRNKNIVTSHLVVNNDTDKKIEVHKNKEASNYPPEKIKLFSANTIIKSSKNINLKQKKNVEHFLMNANSTFVGSKTSPSLDQDEIKQNVIDLIKNTNSSSSELFTIAPLQFNIPEKKDSAVIPGEILCMPNNTQSKCLIIGTAFTYSNSWLLNSDTYEGFNKNNLNQTNLSFGYSYAVLFGYDLSGKYTLQTEYIINNKQEQDYVRYHEGKQVHKKIEINYSHLNLLVKSKQIKYVFTNGMPASLNYMAGIQYGHIKSISRTINDKTRSVTNRYRKNNYSLLLGVEYQLTIKQLWVISTGLRADIGVRNIYAGNAIIPSSFNRTYNSSFGLNIGVSYIVPLKIKK